MEQGARRAFLETSAKTGHNVKGTKLFKMMLQKLCCLLKGPSL